MDDDARTMVEHLRQQYPVQPDRWKQILIERAPPFSVIEHGEADARSGSRATLSRVCLSCLIVFAAQA